MIFLVKCLPFISSFLDYLIVDLTCRFHVFSAYRLRFAAPVRMATIRALTCPSACSSQQLFANRSFQLTSERKDTSLLFRYIKDEDRNC